jgi:hypothetical protein
MDEHEYERGNVKIVSPKWETHFGENPTELFCGRSLKETKSPHNTTCVSF